MAVLAIALGFVAYTNYSYNSILRTNPTKSVEIARAAGNLGDTCSTVVSDGCNIPAGRCFGETTKVCTADSQCTTPILSPGTCNGLGGNCGSNGCQCKPNSSGGVIVSYTCQTSCVDPDFPNDVNGVCTCAAPKVYDATRPVGQRCWTPPPIVYCPYNSNVPTNVAPNCSCSNLGTGWAYTSSSNYCYQNPDYCACPSSPVLYNPSSFAVAGGTNCTTQYSTYCSTSCKCPVGQRVIGGYNSTRDYNAYYPGICDNATQCEIIPVCTCENTDIAKNPPNPAKPKEYNYDQVNYPQCPTKVRDALFPSYGGYDYYLAYRYTTYCQVPISCQCPTGYHIPSDILNRSYQYSGVSCPTTTSADFGTYCKANTCTNGATNYPYCTLSCICANGAPNFTGPVDVVCPTAGQPGYNCPDQTRVCQCNGTRVLKTNAFQNSYVSAVACDATNEAANCTDKACPNGAPLSTYPACILSCPCPNGAPNFNSPLGLACPTIGQAGYSCPNVAQICACPTTPTQLYAIDGNGNYTQTIFQVPDQVSCTQAAKDANCRAQVCTNGAPASTYPQCIASCPCPNGAPNFNSPPGVACPTVGQAGYFCPNLAQFCSCPTGSFAVDGSGNYTQIGFVVPDQVSCTPAAKTTNCRAQACTNGAPASSYPQCIASCPCPNGAPNFNSPPGVACPGVGQAGYFCPNLAQYCPCPTGEFAIDSSGNYTQSGFVVPDQVSCTPVAKTANCRAQACANGAPSSTYPLCIKSCPCPNGANPYTSPAGANCAAVSETTCPSCPPGSFRLPDGSCGGCTGNTIINGAATGCIACPPGTVANINHTKCEQCTGNTIANPTLARCDACPAGTIPNTAHTACGICDGIPSNGIPDCNQNCSFNGGEGKPLCKVCEPGVGGVLPAGCVVCAETPTAPTPACGTGVCDVIPTDNGVFQCPATPACNNVAGDGIPDCVQVCDYIFGNAIPDCKVCDTIVGNNIPDCNCTENPDAGIALCGPGVCDNDIPKDNSIKQCPALTCSTDPSVDTDGDGIKDVLEAAGPNNGDGNGDGISDCIQNTVATTPTGAGTKYVSIIAKGNGAGLCKAITGASVTTESDNSKQDSSYEYPFGFVNYSVACATTSDIALNWFTGGDNGEVLRGFNPLTPGTASTADYYDQTLTSRQIVSVGSASALQTLFTLTDGQLGDASGVDSNIVNRSGLGAKAAIKPPAPIIITGGSSLSLLFTLSAFIVSIIAVYAIYLRRAGEWNYATIRSGSTGQGNKLHVGKK